MTSFLIQAFVDAGFRGADLKSLNFVQEYIEISSLTDIVTIDGHRTSYQEFEAISSNGLRGNTKWPKVVPELPPAFIALWKKAITKSFINFNSGIPRRLNHGLT